MFMWQGDVGWGESVTGTTSSKPRGVLPLHKHDQARYWRAKEKLLSLPGLMDVPIEAVPPISEWPEISDHRLRRA